VDPYSGARKGRKINIFHFLYLRDAKQRFGSGSVMIQNFLQDEGPVP
jgi:hypothetical protein